jgi:hypothetical protein
MKPSFILGLLVGYVLGSRAGRERYEQIVALGRRVAGSQTVQATAGVLHVQAHDAVSRAKNRLTGGKGPLTSYSTGADNLEGAATDGFHRTS